MPPRIAKKAVTCPDCGASQQEPLEVVNTFCRSCGQHFEIATPSQKIVVAPQQKRAWIEKWTPLFQKFEPLRQHALVVAEPWLLRYEPQIEKFRELYHRWRPPELRRVRCHECARIHETPHLAASTSCPNCNAHIDLYDVLVDSRVTCTVHTRGKLTIKKFGYLNNQLSICGAADIGGGIGGRLFCDGETKIRTAGRLNCEIGSRRIRVERGADVVVAHPIRVRDMIVRGKLTARVYCTGTLRILKRGFLRGEIHARSIVVDKGGLLHADLNIGRFDEESPNLLGTPQERACYMAIEDTVLHPEQTTLQI